MSPRNGAEFSADRLYRFKLWRRWNEGACGRIVAFVMLNPSDADEGSDDPTLRRCIGYAKRWGFDGVDVVNLFARVSTYPRDLLGADHPTGDPRALEALIESAMGAVRVVIAWGRNGGDWPGRRDEVYTALRRCGVPLHAFVGATKNGEPLHPLRLSGTHPLELWASNLSWRAL
jgi:hypothetical protein